MDKDSVKTIKEKNKCILIIFSPMEGIDAFGPFDTYEESLEYYNNRHRSLLPGGFLIVELTKSH